MFLYMFKEINLVAFNNIWNNQNIAWAMHKTMLLIANSFLLDLPFRKRNFFFRMAKVAHINTEEKRISTSIGDLDYDYLVLATGAKNNFFGMIYLL